MLPRAGRCVNRVVLSCVTVGRASWTCATTGPMWSLSTRCSVARRSLSLRSRKRPGLSPAAAGEPGARGAEPGALGTHPHNPALHHSTTQLQGAEPGRWGLTHTTLHYTTQLHNYRGRSQGHLGHNAHCTLPPGGGTTHTLPCHQGEAQRTLYPATWGRHNTHFTLPPGGGTTQTHLTALHVYTSTQIRRLQKNITVDIRLDHKVMKTGSSVHYSRKLPEGGVSSPPGAGLWRRRSSERLRSRESTESVSSTYTVTGTERLR